MKYRLTLFNDQAEPLDSVIIEVPDSVDWPHLGKVVDECRYPDNGGTTKVHLWDGNIAFQTTIKYSTCSATVVAAFIVDELRTTEFGLFSIVWGLPVDR